MRSYTTSITRGNFPELDAISRHSTDSNTARSTDSQPSPPWYGQLYGDVDLVDEDRARWICNGQLALAPDPEEWVTAVTTLLPNLTAERHSVAMAVFAGLFHRGRGWHLTERTVAAIAGVHKSTARRFLLAASQAGLLLIVSPHRGDDSRVTRAVRGGPRGARDRAAEPGAAFHRLPNRLQLQWPEKLPLPLRMRAMASLYDALTRLGETPARASELVRGGRRTAVELRRRLDALRNRASWRQLADTVGYAAALQERLGGRGGAATRVGQTGLAERVNHGEAGLGTLLQGALGLVPQEGVNHMPHPVSPSSDSRNASRGSLPAAVSPAGDASAGVSASQPSRRLSPRPPHHRTARQGEGARALRAAQEGAALRLAALSERVDGHAWRGTATVVRQLSVAAGIGVDRGIELFHLAVDAAHAAQIDGQTVRRPGAYAIGIFRRLLGEERHS